MTAPEDDPVLDDCAARVRSGDRVVIVHGGGPQIDAALAERGIGQERVDGLRVTDAATLAVTEAVLCGNVNKALVRALATRDVRAVRHQRGGRRRCWPPNSALLSAASRSATSGRS